MIRKFVLLAVFAVSIQSAAFAQGKKSNMQASVDKICECMGKIKKDDKDLKKFQEQTIECFSSAAMSELLALAEERKLDLTDQAAMRNLGVEIGKELLKQQCPAYMTLVQMSANGELKKREAVADVASGETVGKVVRVDQKEFVTIVIKDNSGREHSFYWLEHFDGSEKLMATSGKSLVGKEITISWIEKDFFLPKAGNYYKLKQITDLED